MCSSELATLSVEVCIYVYLCVACNGWSEAFSRAESAKSKHYTKETAANIQNTGVALNASHFNSLVLAAINLTAKLD